MRYASIIHALCLPSCAQTLSIYYKWHVSHAEVTALVLLHPNVEDYVDYQHLGNGSEVWPVGDPHRQRSAALCQLVAKLVQETQAHGLKFYFKPYELGFPKQLPRLYPLGLTTPAKTNSTRLVLKAKYRELFERTGADGIVLTAEEVHPRGGYGSMALASSPATVAALAAVFQDAVVDHCGKDLQMRLWRLTGDLRCEKRILNFSRAVCPEPFVPSLSWQNDRF